MASDLYVHAGGGNADEAAKLIQARPDAINDVDADTGEVPLHMAAYAGHNAVIQLLLYSGTPPNVRRRDGRTPLHLAATMGHEVACRLLINNQANVNEPDRDLATPLHLACQSRHPKVVRLLIICGADPSLATLSGKTALMQLDEDNAPEHAARRQDTLNAFEGALTERRRLDSDGGKAGRGGPPGTPSLRNPRFPTVEPVPVSPKEAARVAASWTNLDRTTASPAIAGPAKDSIAGAAKDSIAGAAKDGGSSGAGSLERFTVENMNIGELYPFQLTRTQRALLRRLAERRITDLLGDQRVLDLIQIPTTGSKPKFYATEPPIPSGNYKGAVSAGVFGVPLPLVCKETGTVFRLDNEFPVRVPFIVAKCLEFMNAEGLRQDGIFRKAGSARRVTELQAAFDAKPATINLADFSVHDVAAVLKRFIRELPQPIFTARLQSIFFATLDVADDTRRLACLQLLLTILPTVNRDLLQAVFSFLKKVARHASIEDGNKMTSRNLAVVFAPNMARNLTQLEKPQTAQDLQTEAVEGAQAQRLVEVLIDSFDELFMFQWMKINELPLSRKATIAASGWLRLRPTDAAMQQIGVLRDQSEQLHGARADASTADLTNLVVPASSVPVLADEGDASADSDDDPENTLVRKETIQGLLQARRERFLRQPSQVITEILADLETTAERRLRRLNAQRLQEVTMPTQPATPQGTLDSEDPEDDSVSTNEIQYALLAGADVFTGAALNEEIAKRILSDQKNRYPFIFGDIRTKDLKRWNIQPRRPDTTAGLAGPAADAEAVSVQTTLETINVQHVLNDMRGSIEVKDRRKGLLRSHKSCFLGEAGRATGRDAVSWLCENAVDGKTLTRRQALQLARELLEMGGVQQVYENAHGFKDDSTLYRFSSDAVGTTRPGPSGAKKT